MKDRHPSTVMALRPFTDGEHLAEFPRTVTQLFTELANGLVELLPDDPELTTALRKLRESKDCAVFLAVLNDE